MSKLYNFYPSQNKSKQPQEQTVASYTNVCCPGMCDTLPEDEQPDPEQCKKCSQAFQMMNEKFLDAYPLEVELKRDDTFYKSAFQTCYYSF